MYSKFRNFALQHLKLYTLRRQTLQSRKLFKTYPIWINFYRSRHIERNDANGIKNICLTKKLSHFKVYVQHAYFTKTYLTQSACAILLSPAYTLHSQSPLSPCATRALLRGAAGAPNSIRGSSHHFLYHVYSTNVITSFPIPCV